MSEERGSVVWGLEFLVEVVVLEPVGVEVRDEDVLEQVAVFAERVAH